MVVAEMPSSPSEGGALPFQRCTSGSLGGGGLLGTSSGLMMPEVAVTWECWLAGPVRGCRPSTKWSNRFLGFA